MGAGLHGALAVALHVVGEHWIAEQRHMAEEIVEQVGLDQIVDLGALADPHRHREAPVRQVIVEHRVGNETWHADDAPAGQRFELRVDRVEVGNGLADAEGLADPRRNSGQACFSARAVWRSTSRRHTA